MADFDVLIRNGMIVDGALDPRYRGDVAIRDGIVVELGRVRGSASRQLDATGLVVAPGFVDLHTHYDAQAVLGSVLLAVGVARGHVRRDRQLRLRFRAGAAADREQAMRTLTRVEAIPLEAMRAGLPWSWESFAGFLDVLERTPKAVNLLPYVPVNPLLTWVMGHERAKAGELPTDDEHVAMARTLDGPRWKRAHRVVRATPAAVVRHLRAGTRSRRQPDAQRRDARRDVPRPRGRARRPQRGRHPDDARVGRPQGRRRAHYGRNWPRSAAHRCSTTSSSLTIAGRRCTGAR